MPRNDIVNLFNKFSIILHSYVLLSGACFLPFYSFEWILCQYPQVSRWLWVHDILHRPTFHLEAERLVLTAWPPLSALAPPTVSVHLGHTSAHTLLLVSRLLCSFWTLTSLFYINPFTCKIC